MVLHRYREDLVSELPSLPAYICRVLPVDLCRCCGQCSAQILIFAFVMSRLFPVYCFAAHLPGSSFGAIQR